MAARWLAAIMAWGCLAEATLAAGRFPSTTVSLGLLGDADQGRSYSLSATFDTGERWSFNLGAGHTRIVDSGTELSGDSFSGGFSWQPGNWLIQPAYSHWHDDDQFSSDTPELRIAYRHGAVRWQLQAERPRYALDYQLGSGSLALQRHFGFSGTGVGGGLAYTGLAWSASLIGTGYGYGNEITRLRAIVAAPALTRFPRLSLLTQSLATLAESAADRRWSAAIERRFNRTSVHLDADWQTDALTGAHASALGIGANVALGVHASLDAGIGNQHADGLDDAAFLRVVIGCHW